MYFLFFFAKAIRTIPLGIAYALWEGIAIMLIVSLSYLLFQESVSAFKLLGFVFIVCGIACFKYEINRVCRTVARLRRERRCCAASGMFMT